VGTPQEGPVTVLILRTVRAGREAAFEGAVRGWIQTALTFPGYLGVHMLRPPPGGHEYGAVVKFATRGAWIEFSACSAYRAFLTDIRDYLEEDARIETVTGLESWFTPAGFPVTLAPPPWKMALVTWFGVNLTAVVLTFVLSPLTADWPWVLAFVVFNAGVVAGLTWVVMPALSRLLRPWLTPSQP
jgi:hypothetical protein